VLVIIAILTAIALPSLRVYLQKTHDQLIQQQLVQTVQFAERTADASGMTVGISFDKQSNTLLVFQDKNKNGLIQQESQVLYRQHLTLNSGQLFWRSYPYYRHYFVLMPRNVSTTDNGAFWYCRVKQDKPAWAVMVTRTTQTQVVYPGADGVIRDSRNREFSCR
jgi:Tfp pilus assembly protein FimT